MKQSFVQAQIHIQTHRETRWKQLYWPWLVTGWYKTDW